MKIMNYTSSVPASRSVYLIEQELVENGAVNIGKKYDGGVLLSIMFQIPNEKGGVMCPIQLPANIDAAEAIILKGVRRPRDGTLVKIREQAERTAWKIVYDWVRVQMAMVKLGQAEFMQVFLSYALVGDGEIYYQKLKGNNFKALEYKG